MLVWVVLIGGLALTAAAVALVFAMGRAERRARRTLFRRLGLSEATIELLMARNGDIPAELEFVRLHDAAPAAAPDSPSATERPPTARPAIRLVQPEAAEPATPPAPRDPNRPPGDRRRLRLPGRNSRP